MNRSRRLLTLLAVCSAVGAVVGGLVAWKVGGDPIVGLITGTVLGAGLSELIGSIIEPSRRYPELAQLHAALDMRVLLTDISLWSWLLMAFGCSLFGFGMVALLTSDFTPKAAALFLAAAVSIAPFVGFFAGLLRRAHGAR